MPNHNAFPSTPEHNISGFPEVVQFTDGGLALAFNTPGDRETLGYGSTQKWARSFAGPNSTDMAIIKTRSGNVYGIARGLVLNKDRQTVRELQPEPFEVAIGEPCEIPGVGTSSEVESLYLRYKNTHPGSDMADRQIDIASPFELLEADVTKIIDPQR